MESQNVAQAPRLILRSQLERVIAEVLLKIGLLPPRRPKRARRRRCVRGEA